MVLGFLSNEKGLWNGGQDIRNGGFFTGMSNRNTRYEALSGEPSKISGFLKIGENKTFGHALGVPPRSGATARHPGWSAGRRVPRRFGQRGAPPLKTITRLVEPL